MRSAGIMVCDIRNPNKDSYNNLFIAPQTADAFFQYMESYLLDEKRRSTPHGSPVMTDAEARKLIMEQKEECQGHLNSNFVSETHI